MSYELTSLSLLAITIALTHTVSGPDHYVPFVAMARAGGWSLRGTVLVTLLCGLGHVGSSILLGGLGIAFGTMVTRLEMFEAVRGNVAGWLLIGFGVAYTAWALVQIYRGKPHTHLHVHSDGSVHSHEHTHVRRGAGQHDHVHAHTASPSAATTSPAAAARAEITAWALFTVFIFGPCEPLIPLLMYPAAELSWWDVALVATLFGVVTIVTMTALVVLLLRGADLIRFHWLHRYSNALAGLAIVVCGLAVNFGL